MTSRKWCFTIFIDDVTDLDDSMAKIKLEKVKYLVCQPEVAPSTGKLHIQGFFLANDAIRFKAAKDIIGDDKAHVEMAKGTPEQVRGPGAIFHAEPMRVLCCADVSRSLGRIEALSRRIAPTAPRMSQDTPTATHLSMAS